MAAKAKTTKSTKTAKKESRDLSAVIKLGAKQYLVKVGDKIEAEKIEAKEGEKLTVKDVLLVTDGQKTEVGVPLVESASVDLTFEGTKKGEKVEIRKFRAKSRYRRKTGHRQLVSSLTVSGINWK